MAVELVVVSGLFSVREVPLALAVKCSSALRKLGLPLE